MKRRLRKKLGLGEFQDFYFDVRFQFDSAEADVLMDRWIEEAIEANGLTCGGGGTNGDWSFVVRAGSIQDPESAYQNRHKVREWLNSMSIILQFEVGEFYSDLIFAATRSRRAALRQARQNLQAGLTSKTTWD